MPVNTVMDGKCATTLQLPPPIVPVDVPPAVEVDMPPIALPQVSVVWQGGGSPGSFLHCAISHALRFLLTGHPSTSPCCSLGPADLLAVLRCHPALAPPRAPHLRVLASASPPAVPPLPWSPEAGLCAVLAAEEPGIDRRMSWWTVTVCPADAGIPATADANNGNGPDLDVIEVLDRTPDDQHSAIQMALKSLASVDLGHCTPANLAALMGAHPAWKDKAVHVGMSATPVDAAQVACDGNVSVQCLSGVGTFVITF
ncbi:hypothetical protein Pelo_9482 [Pelomyxa schiedti]|nr:hypothetical protein Pelo_9482 [Pelomyxa schiedti]